MRCRECNSMGMHGFSMCEALSSIFSTQKSKANEWHHWHSHHKKEEQTIREWDIKFLVTPSWVCVMTVDGCSENFLHFSYNLNQWLPLVMDMKINQEQCVSQVATNIGFKRYSPLKDSTCGGVFSGQRQWGNVTGLCPPRCTDPGDMAQQSFKASGTLETYSLNFTGIRVALYQSLQSPRGLSWGIELECSPPLCDHHKPPDFPRC